MKAPIPVLRIFDETLAKAFYVDFLGFTLDWEHRFGDGTPLYLQISRGGCVLHLSEHFGDASPGARVRVEVEGLDDYLKSLREARFKNCCPGEAVQQPWGSREIDIADPFGNHFTFYTQ